MNARAIRALMAVVAAILGGSCAPTAGSPQTPLEPINVQMQVFFNQPCPSSHVIYTVPAGKLLVIEDASAGAVNAATASDPNNPGILPDVPIHLSLRTNHVGQSFGSADHMIVSKTGTPVYGGRTVRGYGAPGSSVLFLVGGCPFGVRLNTSVTFSGQLLEFP